MNAVALFARMAVMAGLFFTSAVAMAQAAALEPREPARIDGADAPLRPHDHLVLGMKGVNTVERAVVDGRPLTISGYGFASVAELSILHGRLGIELDFVFTAPGDELSMAGEPMLKLPWHLRSWLEPYLAAGPLVLRVHSGEGQRYWLGGGQLVLGAFVWLAEMAGIDLDVALGAAHGPGISITELTVAIGPVLRN